MKNPFGILVIIGFLVIICFDSNGFVGFENPSEPTIEKAKQVFDCFTPQCYEIDEVFTSEKKEKFFDTHTKKAKEALSGRYNSKFAGGTIPNSVKKSLKSENTFFYKRE